MSDVYRLVFRGEVLDGQHPAVVRKRLAEAASFDAAALDKLFSGRPVVVKRAADTATAARLQALFKKAGARLRVLPVEDDEAPDSAAPDAAGASADAGPASPESAPAGLTVLPPGAEILREDERTPWQPRDVQTGHLSLEKARFVVADTPARPAGPDVSHLTVAAVGETLGPPRAEPDHPVRAPELDLAAPGELLAPRAAAPVAPVDFASLHFEVAEAGTDLNQQHRPPAPPAPDVSHLTLNDAD